MLAFTTNLGTAAYHQTQQALAGSLLTRCQQCCVPSRDSVCSVGPVKFADCLVLMEQVQHVIPLGSLAVVCFQQTACCHVFLAHVWGKKEIRVLAAACSGVTA